MVKVIKRKDYCGIVVHEDNKYLYVISPKWDDISEKFSDEANGELNLLMDTYDFFSDNGGRVVKQTDTKAIINLSTYEDAIDYVNNEYSVKKFNNNLQNVCNEVPNDIQNETILNPNNYNPMTNPITKAIADDFFNNKENMTILKNLIDKSNNIMKNLNEVVDVSSNLIFKVETAIELLNKEATDYNVEGVKNLKDKIEKIIEAFSNVDNISALVKVAKKFAKEEKEFDAKDYLLD